MFRAVWNGAVLAESSHTVKVEGNHYFPPESPHRESSTSASPAPGQETPGGTGCTRADRILTRLHRMSAQS
jgi:hypothetical protein